MQARVAALVAVVLLVVAVPAAPAGATPPGEELSAVALTAEEVGPGFRVGRVGVVEQLDALGIFHALAIFQRPPSLFDLSFEAVLVLLADAGSVGDRDTLELAARIPEVRRLGLTLTPVAPPETAPETAAYSVAGTVQGMVVTGEALSWRQGSVIAVVAALGTRTASALAPAERQREKLVVFERSEPHAHRDQ